MSDSVDPAVMLAAALVVAYAGARFAGVFFDNVRNTIFERVGQDAARRLAENVFRHIHDLSLRFHLERRTGSLTQNGGPGPTERKSVEEGKGVSVSVDRGGRGSIQKK